MELTSATVPVEGLALAGLVGDDEHHSIGVDRNYLGRAAVGALGGMVVTQAGGVSYGYSMTNGLVTASAPDKRLIYGPGGLLENVMDAPGAGSANAGFQRLDGQIVDEVSGAGGTAIQRRYVFGPAGDEPLVWYEGAGTGDKRYVVADERGSVVAVACIRTAPLAKDRRENIGRSTGGGPSRFINNYRSWTDR